MYYTSGSGRNAIYLVNDRLFNERFVDALQIARPCVRDNHLVQHSRHLEDCFRASLWEEQCACCNYLNIRRSRIARVMERGDLLRS